MLTISLTLGGSTFNSRLPGDLFSLLRPPIPEFTVLGGMMVDCTDINHLLGMTTSWASLKHSARQLLRHASDRLKHPRGTRLVMGNALVARLLYSLSSHSKVSMPSHWCRVAQAGACRPGAAWYGQAAVSIVTPACARPC